MLLGEGVGECAAGDPAAAADDGPESIAGLVLLGQRLLELFRREQLLTEQQRPQLHADAGAPERRGEGRLG